MNEIAPRYTFLGNSFDRDIQYFTDDSRVSYKTKSTRIAYQIFARKKLQKNVQTIHQSFTLWFQRCLVGKLKISAAQMWQLSTHLMG